MNQKIKLISIEELAEKGWKYSESKRKIYIGRADFPTLHFDASLNHLLGKEFVYEGHFEKIYSRDNFTYLEISDHTGTYNVPSFLVTTKLPKVKKFERKVLGETVRFDGARFRFPCAFSELRKEDAKKLAKWILKV